MVKKSRRALHILSPLALPLSITESWKLWVLSIAKITDIARFTSTQHSSDTDSITLNTFAVRDWSSLENDARSLFTLYLPATHGCQYSF